MTYQLFWNKIYLKIKDVFDPKWLLNPIKVFPLDASVKRREGASQETAA